MPKRPVGFAATDETVAVFARVPAAEAKKLDRAAFALKRPKQEIVAALLSGLEPGVGGLVVGRHEFEPIDEVLTLEQAARLLKVDEDELEALAAEGQVPGRRLGEAWRFSRSALLEWLAAGGV